MVMRNRRVGLPHALNALTALQVVYVAVALALLVIVISAGRGVVPESGAWFALLTVEDGMSKFRAWFVHRAVRTFGGKNTRPRTKERNPPIYAP